MENEKEQLEALQDIRKMMKDSSKFLSLSGLSGVFAGVYALAGACLGYKFISHYVTFGPALNEYDHAHLSYNALLIRIALICGAVLFFSIGTAFIMTNNKAKKRNQKMFDHTSKKLLWNMIVPLVTGGLLCIALLLHHDLVYISPVMLLFYGMALVSASKYTMSDIKYLGYFELLLGIAASFWLGYGLFFWTLGFGVMHIIYGTIMWFKYDRKNYRD